MIAPSEKHLEDWIIANFDDYMSEGEDYFSYAGHQIELPSGRCDLLGFSWKSMGEMTIHVVELKKGEITLTVLAQLLRYFRDIKKMWKFCLEGLYYTPGDQWNYAEADHITGALVGKSVTDDVLIACEALNITVSLYDYDPDTELYSFTPVSSSKLGLDRVVDCSEGTFIRSCIRDVYLTNVEKFVPEDVQQEYMQPTNKRGNTHKMIEYYRSGFYRG